MSISRGNFKVQHTLIVPRMMIIHVNIILQVIFMTAVMVINIDVFNMIVAC